LIGKIARFVAHDRATQHAVTLSESMASKVRQEKWGNTLPPRTYGAPLKATELHIYS
jgi:hypothetical protein